MTGDLKQRLDTVKERIARACIGAGRSPDAVRLVVVTKNQPVDAIQAVIDLGVRDIGENRVQEIESKAPVLKGAAAVHMIGHLQTNKIGKVLPYVDWIQSVDSVRLLEKLEQKAAELDRCPEILVEVNTSGEEAKSGCTPQECANLCARAAQSRNLRFRGLMTIGPLSIDERQTRRAFSLLRTLGQTCPVTGGLELSMGMSQDFEWAIAEGATIVRIGSYFFDRK